MLKNRRKQKRKNLPISAYIQKLKKQSILTIDEFILLKKAKEIDTTDYTFEPKDNCYTTYLND